MALNSSVEPKHKVDLRTIIEQNLDLMLSQGDGMIGRINNDSWGVNAGVDENGSSKVAANFLYNPHNGKIRLFGNLGSCADWDTPYHSGYYRKGTFLLSHVNGGPLQITKVIGLDGLVEEAKKNILKSAGVYNRQNKRE